VPLTRSSPKPGKYQRVQLTSYTMATTRGVPERRLAQMSRDEILALLQPGRAVRVS